MYQLKIRNLLLTFLSLFIFAACASTNQKPKPPFKMAVSKDIEIEWAAGIKNLKPNLGVSGSCPTPDFMPHQIPNESGIGLGVCFIPKVNTAHATLGILYTITLPGDGVINPETKERIKQVRAYTNCYNERRCFGGYIPAQYERISGEWLIEFYLNDRKIIEHSFVMQPQKL